MHMSAKLELELYNNYESTSAELAAVHIENLLNKNNWERSTACEFISNEDNALVLLIKTLRCPSVENKIKLADMFVDFAKSFREEERIDPYWQSKYDEFNISN